MISRSIYLIVCGCVLAAIIHITAVLMIPALGAKDAARQIIRSSPELSFKRLDETSAIKIATADPFFQTAVCRFKLDDGGIFISGDKIPAFWSAAVYNARGQVLYSLNDRTAIGNKLQILIVSPVQMAALRQLQPDEIETSIIVETSAQDGFVLLRSLVREDSLATESNAFINSARCSVYQPAT